MELPTAVAVGATSYDVAKQVLLLPGNDASEGYLVDRAGLLRLSKVARNVLEAAADDEPLPLDNAHCTPSAIARFAVWVNHHAAPGASLTRVSYPLPVGDLELIFEPWDLEFIQTLLVPAGDMTNSRELFAMMGVAVYLGCFVLLEAACGYLSWHVRRVSESSNGTPTEAVRAWFGMAGDFSDAELRSITEKHQWCKNIDPTQLEEDSEEAHQCAAGLVGVQHGTAGAAPVA